MRRLAIAVAVALAAVAGVAAASVVSPGTASEPRQGGRDELPSGSVRSGEPVEDPEGGPSWVARVFDGDSSRRCLAVARTDGRAFGPADAAGRIRDTGDVASGSCADPADEPLQVALARFADSGGSGARSVLLGVADASVVSVTVLFGASKRQVALDGARTFVVVRRGLREAGTTTVEARLSDGSSRTYRL
jgi:hypothetical protein